jgi:DNA-binding transcriptional LysR family regulator
MNFRTFELNLLRVFDEVMSERSLTRAADNLAMTQPAVSNAMKRLREALGDDLVARAGYGVEPTPRAVALWPAVREALAGLQASIAPAPFDPLTTVQNFTLTMADATAALLMPQLVREIEALNSNITLRVVPLTTRDPRKILEAHAADLAVGYFPAAIAAIGMMSDSLNNFSHTRLYNSEYVCVMRKDNPVAKNLKRKPFTVDDFCNAHHLLVSFSGRPFGMIDSALAAINRKRQVVLTVNQFFTAGRVVAGSDLLTVLPRHFLDSTGMMDQLIAVDLPFHAEPVHVDMVWHRSLNLNGAQQWLRGAVERAAGAVNTKQPAH